MDCRIRTVADVSRWTWFHVYTVPVTRTILELVIFGIKLTYDMILIRIKKFIFTILFFSVTRERDTCYTVPADSQPCRVLLDGTQWLQRGPEKEVIPISCEVRSDCHHQNFEFWWIYIYIYVIEEKNRTTVGFSVTKVFILEKKNYPK